MCASKIVDFPEQNKSPPTAIRRLIEVFQATGLLYKAIASKVDDYNLRKMCAEQVRLRSKFVSELGDYEEQVSHSDYPVVEDAEKLQQCYTQLEPNTDNVEEGLLRRNLVDAERSCVGVLRDMIPKVTDSRLKQSLAGIVAQMQIALDRFNKTSTRSTA
ncbi:hypothetical protein OE749_03805 [Aestuariibacter sp. AA17]|uniref:DUF2383 domain-containing protein n=1 Tax=Fluctibacter corallii TaxID=2984329 RepID=A0ABT3A575_9ALTE|nr:hypothetical protein [Aestuariibacter sp. AA17]MCV2883825.1 hypothetical protein [Aestuariibacter sp. AA17]